MDHSPGCRKLQAATGAPTFGYGPHGAGKQEQGIAVEEGGDMDFCTRSSRTPWGHHPGWQLVGRMRVHPWAHVQPYVFCAA